METPQFFNTRTRAIEVFSPVRPNQVQMYHCGPTLYANAHLGNLCPFIYWDVMRRMFESLDYDVTQVMNFTDIGHIVSDADSGDDKMVSALIKSGKELNLENLHSHGQEIASTYLNDLSSLNILTPHHMPYASQHIDEDITIIEKLLAKGNAYITNDAIYFDTSTVDSYDYFQVHGDLDIDHQRITPNESKRSPRDFSLWKFSDKDSLIGWPSPWGIGFPGWHIECSAMAWRYLGETFDIHTGGIEHVSVHHTNEIAQSESAFDKPMARYWLHNNHLQLNGEKISKSDGNVIYLDELDAYGLHAMDYRYLILTSHYRSEQNLTIKSLEASRQARISLWRILSKVDDSNNSSSINLSESIPMQALINDLDTPKALAQVRQLIKLETVDLSVIKSFIIDVLGVTFDDLEKNTTTIDDDELPENILDLLNQRQIARKNNDYKTADTIRTELLELGYQITDNNTKQEITKL